MTSKLLPVAVLSALLGAAGAVGAVALLEVGGRDRVTTVVQQAPLAGPRAADGARTPGQALTPREIYERDAPGVVFIRAQVLQQSASPFDLGFDESRQQALSTGSGFVIDGEGKILTNAHVIDGAVRVSVQFQDKKTVDARVVGKDVSSDLALLEVDPDGLDLKPLPLGSSDNVQVGDPVIAIGNPFGLDRTLTTGVVSALQRRIQAQNDFAITNVIQTDAAINPGNSGGPLIDATGRVIGVNSQIATGGGGGGNVGIAFAVPIDTAKEILPQLEEDGRVDRAYLGITSLTIDSSLDGLGLPTRRGALVQTVQQGSPADAAGLRAGAISARLGGGEIVLGGDVIVSIAGRPVRTSEDIGMLIASREPGEKVKVGIVRDGDRDEITVELGSRPEQVTTG